MGKKCSDTDQKSVADILIDIGLANIKTSFIDQYGEPFVQTNEGRILPINSKDFHTWLGSLYFASERKGLDRNSYQTACETLSAYATYQGAGKIELHYRVAWHDNALWYDLGDTENRAVKITANGWETINEVPILFRRYGNQAPQIEPTRGGDVSEFLIFVNVTDNNTKLLLLVWLIASFIPDFPHVILIVSGSQGAAKSSCCRYSKRVIDPGVVLTESMPNEKKDLAKTLNNQWFSAFDNLNTLSQQQSDSLCRAVTKDGFKERKLYTNNDEFILNYQRIISLNGINLCAQSPDILDRSIIVELDRIPSEQRKPEDVLNEEFTKALPGILGGIFSVLSKAIALRPKLESKLKNFPRMADFAKWGYVIAEALGGYGEEFLNAYNLNMRRQHEAVIDSHLVAQALVEFMGDKEQWQGFAMDLLKELTAIAERMEINTDVYPWPQQPNQLTKIINKLKATLKEAGIMEIDHKHTSFGNLTMIFKPRSTMKVMKVDEDGNDLSKSSPEAIPEGNEGNEGAFSKKNGKEIREKYIEDRKNTFITFTPSSDMDSSGFMDEGEYEDSQPMPKEPSLEVDYEVF